MAVHAAKLALSSQALPARATVDKVKVPKNIKVIKKKVARYDARAPTDLSQKLKSIFVGDTLIAPRIPHVQTNLI